MSISGDRSRQVVTHNHQRTDGGPEFDENGMPWPWNKDCPACRELIEQKEGPPA